MKYAEQLRSEQKIQSQGEMERTTGKQISEPQKLSQGRQL